MINAKKIAQSAPCLRASADMLIDGEVSSPVLGQFDDIAAPLAPQLSYMTSCILRTKECQNRTAPLMEILFRSVFIDSRRL